MFAWKMANLLFYAKRSMLSVFSDSLDGCVHTITHNNFYGCRTKLLAEENLILIINLLNNAVKCSLDSGAKRQADAPFELKTKAIVCTLRSKAKMSRGWCVGRRRQDHTSLRFDAVCHMPFDAISIGFLGAKSSHTHTRRTEFWINN